MAVKPSIVFCHGIWADGSCFSKVIPPLQAEGYEVMAAQYGLDSTWKTSPRRCAPWAGSTARPSWSATPTAAASSPPRAPMTAWPGWSTSAALGPDETETSQGQQDKFPATPVFSQIEVADGRVWMLPSGAAYFCGDLPEEEQKLVWATHYAPAADLFLHNAPGVAWRSKPSWCIVANNDQTVNPELERFAAKRMGATTYDIDSSHVPMLSHPDFVLDVIRAAATAVQGSVAA